MKSLFLSYSRKDLDDINEIRRVLIAGGIRTWQDIDSLSTGRTENEILQAINHECFSFFFYATTNSLKSNFIKNVELKEAHRRCGSDNLFDIVPLFKTSVNFVNKKLKGVISSDISTFNGAVIDKNHGLKTGVRKIRKFLLKKILKNCTEPVIITVMSTLPSGYHHNATLDMNWFNTFPSDVIMTQKVWDEYICTALRDVKETLSEIGITNIKIISKAHLSIGFAFGFIFRETSGFSLNILQNNQWWSNSEAVSKNSPFAINVISNDINSTCLCLDLSINKNVEDAINLFVKNSKISFRSIIRCAPLQDNFSSVVLDSAETVTITESIINKINNVISNHRITEIHIFAAIPLGLAYMIGAKLNACGRVHLYEFDKNKREYLQSWTIDGND